MATCDTNINNLQANNQTPNTTMENYLKQQQQLEDQIDYQFIQRIIQELTQSCALNVPIPASAIPNLILQAAQFFWENDDQSIEERYYCIPFAAINKYGANRIIKLPPQIISVFGVYKLNNSFNYGVLGDFSLERMILNNSALAAGAGGSLSDVFGTGTGYNLTDVMGALYEVQTYKYMFDYPMTFNYNQYSNELVLLGSLGHSDIMLQVYKRLKIQDLYKSYYFFRYCVCLGLRSMATIMGTYEFKLPGGITINYQAWRDQAQTEMDQIYQWMLDNHSADYFFNTNTI
jgi:hypothetical protein